MYLMIKDIERRMKLIDWDTVISINTMWAPHVVHLTFTDGRGVFIYGDNRYIKSRMLDRAEKISNKNREKEMVCFFWLIV